MAFMESDNPMKLSESELVRRSNYDDVDMNEGNGGPITCLNSLSIIMEANDTLLIDQIRKDKLLLYILICSGLCSHKYLTKDSFAYYLAIVTVPLSKVAAVTCVIYYSQLMISTLATSNSGLDGYLIFCYCFLCFIAQNSLLIPISSLIIGRLEEQRTSSIEAMYFTKAKTVFYQSLSLMFFILPLYIIVAVSTGYQSGFLPDILLDKLLYFPLYIVSQTYSSLYLSATLMVFAADGMFTCNLLQEIVDASKKQDLTLSELQTVRNIIHKIYAPYSGIASVISWMALTNVAAFLLRIYSDYKDWQSFFAALGYYGKELPFALVICYFSSSVNDLADQLLLVLSKSEWRNEVKETQRVKMFVLEIGEPISFYVFSRRIGTKQLTVEVIGLIGAILVAIIRVLVYATEFSN